MRNLSLPESAMALSSRLMVTCSRHTGPEQKSDQAHFFASTPAGAFSRGESIGAIKAAKADQLK